MIPYNEEFTDVSGDMLPESSEYKDLLRVDKHVTDIGRGTAGIKSLS
jgi:hypothetical protein